MPKLGAQYSCPFCGAEGSIWEEESETMRRRYGCLVCDEWWNSPRSKTEAERCDYLRRKAYRAEDAARSMIREAEERAEHLRSRGTPLHDSLADEVASVAKRIREIWETGNGI